ncbi:MAG: hypothetical protein AAGD14_14055 [Planctomycetota bacterium]
MKRSAFLPFLLLAACGGGGGSDSNGNPGPAIIADFQLEDVNDTSTRFGAMVSPRDYIGNVSAWYFGSAT